MSILEELKKTALNFQKQKKNIEIISDEELNNIDVKIIKIDYKDGTWDIKNTQFNTKTRCIEVAPSYDIEKDLNKDIIHEKCHAILTAKGYSNSSDKFHPYPSNPLEQIAYTTQIYHLLRAGNTPDDIKNNSELKYYFEKHPKELNRYLTRAQEQYDKDIKLKIFQKNFNRN